MRELALALTCAASLTSAQAPSPAAGAAMELSGFVSAWRQDCSDGCRLPVGQGRGEAASLSVGVPDDPGEARVAKLVKTLALGAGETLRVDVTVYFVCPRGAAGDGADPCPTRYLQVQVALSGGARAFCAASLNVPDARPFPVLMCAGENLRRPGERLGVSLSRREVQVPD